MPTSTATMTVADILKYQNDLVRTGKGIPLGRMNVIAIAPNKGCDPHIEDPIMRRFGRMIHLRHNLLPIAQSPDRSMLLVTRPLIDRDGRVALPDVPDPDWIPEAWTREETTGEAKRDPSKDRARMIPQRLEDRAEGYLERSQFLVFSPVLYVTFQPELGYEMQGTIWRIECRYNPADRTDVALLIHRETGETHFFGGLFDISTGVGE